MSDSIYLTNHCHFLHRHSQCLHLPHMHTSHSHPLHWIPQCIIISLIHYIGYTALCKILYIHFWWDVLPCFYELQWLINTFIFLEPMKIHNFFMDGVSGVNNLKYMCCGFLCCVCGLIRVHGSFYGFQFVDWSGFYFLLLQCDQQMYTLC